MFLRGVAQLLAVAEVDRALRLVGRLEAAHRALDTRIGWTEIRIAYGDCLVAAGRLDDAAALVLTEAQRDATHELLVFGARVAAAYRVRGALETSRQVLQGLEGRAEKAFDRAAACFTLASEYVESSDPYAAYRLAEDGLARHARPSLGHDLLLLRSKAAAACGDVASALASAQEAEALATDLFGEGAPRTRATMTFAEALKS